MTTTESNISFRKKIFFYIVIILTIIITLELCSFVILKIKLEKYSSSSLISDRNDIINNNETEIVNKPSVIVLHPYLGYVYNPETNNKNMTLHHGGLPISEYGFIDSNAPFYEDKEDTIIIGIFGGSVAYYFSVFGVDSLIDQLKYSSFFKNKKIGVVRVALGGYKQPQQLLSLTYLLSLGAHFDIVINLDGFNEVALPPVDNITNNVSPIFPRNWHWQSEKLMSNQTKSLIGIIRYLREKREKYASTFNKRIVRYSNVMNLIWIISDRLLVDRIKEKQIALSSSMNKGSNNYERSGPKYSYTNTSEMYHDLANYWKQSSQQMARICEANNILYWHFLQPNQYVYNSKTLNEEEKKIAFSNKSPYKEPVEHGYPVLQEKGIELSNSSIQFHDLTMIFEDRRDTLYSDSCCHLNDKGNEILGKIIGKLIVEDIEKSNDN